MASDESPLSNVQPGDILAEKYRVERVLGQGGMGVVVLAEHLDLRERVAIKFLLDAPAGNLELAERFLREARAAVKIKSEHVVRVIDVGRLPSNSPYMVMEYLEGEDLSQRLAAGALPIEDAVDYVIQSCEAMHVAHRAGIVHRDLKPANLFLTQRPDGSPLIKVLDFGISKVKSADPNQLSLTHTQAMMGSPLYMSPEQMRSSKDVNAAADIWSLGVILHELISGDVPFSGETFPEVLVKVMSEQPAPLRSLRADVPAGLEAVILHCLRKDPTQRPASVAALAVALAPFASSRTAGILTRLRGSLSRPPPAPPPPSGARSPLALDATRLTDAGVAPPAALPPQHTLTSAGTTQASTQGELHPAKTHTAWGGPPAPVAAAIPSWRRHRPLVIAAGALVVAGIVAVGLMNGESGPGGASAASNANLPSAPAALPPPPNVAPLPRAPSVAPVREAAPAEPANAEAEEPAAAKTDVGEAATSAPPAPEHKPAAEPTEATVQASSTPRTARTPALKSKTATTKTPRVRATAKTTTNVPTTNVETPTPASPPPAKPRSKSLSIEFK